MGPRPPRQWTWGTGGYSARRLESGERFKCWRKARPLRGVIWDGEYPWDTWVRAWLFTLAYVLTLQLQRLQRTWQRSWRSPRPFPCLCFADAESNTSERCSDFSKFTGLRSTWDQTRMRSNSWSKLLPARPPMKEPMAWKRTMRCPRKKQARASACICIPPPVITLHAPGLWDSA